MMTTMLASAMCEPLRSQSTHINYGDYYGCNKEQSPSVPEQPRTTPTKKFAVGDIVTPIHVSVYAFKLIAEVIEVNDTFPITGYDMIVRIVDTDYDECKQHIGKEIHAKENEFEFKYKKYEKIKLLLNENK